MPKDTNLILKGLDPQLYRQFKASCQLNGSTIKAAITELMELYVKKVSKPEPRKEDAK